MRGTRRGREAAALNAASAALGSVAMIGFAATFLATLFYGAAAAVGSEHRMDSRGDQRMASQVGPEALITTVLISKVIGLWWSPDCPA
jgi:hypothetical protein